MRLHGLKICLRRSSNLRRSFGKDAEMIDNRQSSCDEGTKCTNSFKIENR